MLKRSAEYIITQHTNNKQYTKINKYTGQCNAYDRCSVEVCLQNNGNNHDLLYTSLNENNNSNNVYIDSHCQNDNYLKCLNIFKSNNKFIKILNFNAQGLLESEHFEHIFNYNHDLKADIIAIEETWLHKSIINKMVEMNEYKIFRSDRNFKRANKQKGGGVCAYIKNNLKAKCIEKSNGTQCSLIDYLILEIISPKTKFLFCNIYRHSDCSDIETNNVFNRINELSVEYLHVIICGDLNANKFDRNKYIKLHTLSDYMQLVNDDCPTYIAGNFNPSQLDLMFTKDKNDVKYFGHFSAIGISNHQAIYGIFITYTTKKEINTYKIRNFQNIDQSEINHFVETIDWNIFSINNGIDEMINYFYLIMERFMNEMCPEQIITSKNKPVPWMTKEIKNKMNERKMFYDWWKLNRKHQSGEIIYESYRKLNGQVKRLIRESKKNTFIYKYNEANELKQKWQLIHNFGITSKSKKMRLITQKLQNSHLMN